MQIEAFQVVNQRYYDHFEIVELLRVHDKFYDHESKLIRPFYVFFKWTQGKRPHKG